MAAGRGEFFRSLLEGLERIPPRPEPAGGRRAPGRGGGRGRSRRPQREAPSPVSVDRWTRPRAQTKREDLYKVKTSPSEENFMEKLPPEVLIKILSYLDASSLFCIGHVSKLLHQLANDDVMWQRIYMSEFGGQMWRPKSADDAAVEAEGRTAACWKKMYFRSVAGQEMNTWRREKKEVSLNTGLPRQTEWTLRNLNVSWELTVRDRRGEESRMQQSRAYFFETSVIVRWSEGRFPKYHHISQIRLHGVRREAAKSPALRKPRWRSLILKLDVKTRLARFIGRDGLIRLMLLSPGFIVGVWRGHDSVAFIMVSLHFHRLVEKSLLGTPVCPYVEPVDRAPVDHSDPEFGLHGYSLHFVLHNTGSEIMSGHFRHLSCRKVQIRRGLVELKVIEQTELSQHRSLSGNIRLPWKSADLEGSVEVQKNESVNIIQFRAANCCIVTLTLLDEFIKPFWCVSSPVCVTTARKAPSFDYDGEHFLMCYHSSEGQMKMKLVWLKEQKQFFLISLTIYVSVSKVNKYFSRNY